MGRPRRGTRGSILLENMIAIAIITIVGLSLLAMLQRAMAAVVKAREQASCARALQSGHSRLKNIDFYALFAVDSSSANYGLWAAYPFKATLDAFRTSLSASRFDRFKVSIVFLRRDSSDSNADGLTSDLVAFRDADGDRADDYDSGVRWFDQNADGDYYDTYTAAGRTVAEQPDTHVKQVTLQVFRRGRLVCAQTEIVSLEQYSGDLASSSEAVLRLLVSTPSNAANLYSRATTALAASQDLAVSSGLPQEPSRLRADALSPLVLAGETDALSSVEVYVGASALLASVAVDAAGGYSSQPLPATAALVEGTNVLRLRAVKDAYTSPWTQRSVVLDLRPPTVSAPSPTGTVATYAPQVTVRLADAGVATTTTSGICPDVLALRVNGSTVPARYDAATGSFTWVDASGLTPVLSSGTYTVAAEASDYAGYKSSLSWTFTVSVPDTDNSAPAVSNKYPIGSSAPAWPEVSVRVQDNQSGVDPARITLTLDGAVVVDAWSVGTAFDPGSGFVRYTPPSAFDAGSLHTVTVSVSHWATTPADKVTTTDSWSFAVP